MPGKLYAALFIIGLSGLLFSAFAGQPDGLWTAEDSWKRPYRSGELLVLLSSDDFEDSRKGLERTLSEVEQIVPGRIMKRIALKLGAQVLQVKLRAGTSVAQALSRKQWGQDSRILAVEPNYRVHSLLTPNDPYYSSLWGLHNTGQNGGNPDADCDAPEAWEKTTGSSDVIVAVVDSGVDYHHPDLMKNIWVNTDEIENNGLDDDGNGFVDDVYGYDFYQNDNEPLDEDGHGTHCAGIIAAVGNNSIGITGVSWASRVMVCRFLDDQGEGYISDAISAIEYAVNNGARIINCSWGGSGYSENLKAAIENAQDQGVLFVAAAGNSAADNDDIPFYPSSYQLENMISVAASNDRDQLASFSNYGAESVHLAAPGSGILSTVPNFGADYSEAYSWYSGTSMAAPHVAGAGALLLTLQPSLSVAEMKTKLIYSGDPLPDLENTTLSGCRLNLHTALADYDNLIVLSPNGGESLVLGTQAEIQWIPVPGRPLVDIFLLCNGKVQAVLARDIPNNGNFIWEIAPDLARGSKHQVRIEDGQQIDDSDAAFTLGRLQTFYTEDFESGLGDFSIDNEYGDGKGLWHLTADCRSLDSDHSSSRALYYGLDAQCNYDSGMTEGVVTSPEISLVRRQQPLRLEFSYFLETEGHLSAYDIAQVEVSENGGSFQQVAGNSDLSLLDPSGTWLSATVDLSEFQGSSVRIRFRFRTGDNSFNEYPGMYVDDLTLLEFQGANSLNPGIPLLLFDGK